MAARRRRRGGRDIFALMMLANAANTVLNNTPVGQIWVTALFAGISAGVHFLVDDRFLIDGCCLSAKKVWVWGDWPRMVTFHFIHMSDWHLYYNISSFLYKGVKLERRLGHIRFLITVLASIIGVSLIYVIIAAFLSEYLNEHYFFNQCVVGFSGVMFSLKVLVTSMSGAAYQRYWGLEIPTKYFAWFELVLMYFLYPHTSLLMHFSGILFGLLVNRGLLEPLFKLVENANLGGRWGRDFPRGRIIRDGVLY